MKSLFILLTLVPAFMACEFRPNMDIDPGRNLAELWASDKDSCCGACMIRQRCQGFVYISWKSWGKKCYLKESSDMVPIAQDVLNLANEIYAGSFGDTDTNTGPSGTNGPHRFTVENRCSYPVWPAVLAVKGGAPFNGGWEQQPGTPTSFNLPRNWSGRIWGRRSCNFDSNGQGSCESGDCGRGLHCSGAGGRPPATLAEWTLDAHAGLDFYDVSNVDGFNMPLAITVQGNHDSPSGYRCTTADCPADINAICPDGLQVRSRTSSSVIGCKSACLAFHSANYCCSGEFSTPDKCNASKWPRDYPKIFKDACPKAYSYAYDDKTSTFTCKGSETGYKVTFCP